ncbi:MAG: gliding motility lipoprotein GldD [Bacteroidia bacterium]|nr:gliding motility lipoprotein GldD [Bacteroidia bacterium]
MAFFLLIICIACEEDDAVPLPKPRGYYILEFPNKSYRRWDTVFCPFSFEIPLYARMEKKDTFQCWWNMALPKNKAMLHLSYKTLTTHPLPQLIEDCRTLAIKHQIKAMGLEEIPVIIDSSKVYGLIYNIMGNTASNLQFYITDSVSHFLRGSLYFNAYPNYDSLLPAIQFFKEDIIRLIRTTRWK